MLRMLLRVRNILGQNPPRLKTDTLLLRLKTHARIKERTQNALCRRKRRRLCRRQRQKDARVPNTLFPSWTLRAPRLKTAAINSFFCSLLGTYLGLNKTELTQKCNDENTRALLWYHGIILCAPKTYASLLRNTTRDLMR